MKITILSAILCIACSTTAAAQSLAVNTDGSAADASALLDIKSTTKGVLVPRMTKTERNAIGSPASGLLVFQAGPDSTGFYFYSSGRWQWLTSADNTDTLVWKRSGNAGTVAASHFLGTTDNRPLRFRINNRWAGEFDSTKRSVYLGMGAGQSTGIFSTGNVGIGNAALRSNFSGEHSIAIGDSTSYTATFPYYTIAIGNKALYKNTGGQRMLVIGDSAMYNNTFGTYSTAIGNNSMLSNSTGYYNTAVGYQSLYSNTTGNENVALGHVAGFSNTTGFWQTAIGDSALYSITGTGHNSNTALGTHAGAYNTSASGCIFIGLRSGWHSSGGFGSIYMGSYAGENSSGDYSIAIGQQALRNNSDDRNLAIGAFTLEQNISGNQNTAVGASALTKDTTGRDNTAIGYWSMGFHRQSNQNTALGSQTLLQDTIGAQNVAIGYQSMYQYNGSRNTAVGTSSLDFGGGGNANTALGYSADVGVDGLFSATAIGAFARCDTSNSIVLGNTTGTNVAIGTTKPLSRMDVAGSLGVALRTISLTGTYALSVTDHTVILSSAIGSSAVTITLPAAGNIARREYRIVNQNSSAKTISTYTDFTGNPATTIPGNNAIIVQSNGTGWVRVM